MNHLNKFNSNSEYNQNKDNLELPNVSISVNENEVHYKNAEMEQIKVAINAGSAQYIFGNIKGSEYTISITSSNYCNMCNNEGKILYPQGGAPFNDSTISMIKNKLSSYNIENVSSMIESYEQFQILNDWNEYTIIN